MSPQAGHPVRVYSTGHSRMTVRHDVIFIARAAVHARHLRPVSRDGDLDASKLLTEHRRELVVAPTRAFCPLHRLLRELTPGGAPRELSADRAARLLRSVRPADPAEIMREDIAKDHIADIRALRGAGCRLHLGSGSEPDRSPCRDMKLPKSESARARILNGRELQGLHKELPEQYRPMLTLGAVLGLRFGEVAVLRVGRVDLVEGVLHVAEALGEAEGRLFTKYPRRGRAGARFLCRRT